MTQLPPVVPDEDVRALLATLGLGAATVTRPDDLTSLFTAQPAQPAPTIRYRQGIILNWDPVTLENTVMVGGTLLTDLPVLGAAEAASYHEGTVVGLAVIESTWAIIGRFVIPNTADAEDAITQVGQRAQTATVTTQETTTSAPYVDLATPGPSVTTRIAASGKAFVTVSAQFGPNTGTQCVGTIGVEVSGDASIAPNTQQSLILVAPNAGLNGSRMVLFTGLPAGGLCTFTLKYGSNGIQDMQFSNRDIIVETK